MSLRRMCCARSLSGSGSGGGGTVIGGAGYKIWDGVNWIDAPYQQADYEKLFGTEVTLDDVAWTSIPECPVKGSFHVIINSVTATFPSIDVVIRKEDATGVVFGMGITT